MWPLWTIWNKHIKRYMVKRESIIGVIVIQMLEQKVLVFIWTNFSAPCPTATPKNTSKAETTTKNT